MSMEKHKVKHSSTHTYTHFNGPLSRTTWVIWHQKGKTDLDFTKARDSEWQWHQLGYMQVCTSLQTDNHASTPPLSFLQTGWPSCSPANSVKALKAQMPYQTCQSLIISKICRSSNVLMIQSLCETMRHFAHYKCQCYAHRIYQVFCRFLLTHTKQVFVQLPTSADNVALPASGRHMPLLWCSCC